MSPDVHTPDRLSLAAHGARPRSGEGTRIPTCAEGAARRRAEPYTDGQYHDSGGGVPGYVEFPDIGNAVTRHPLRHAYVPEDAGTIWGRRARMPMVMMREMPLPMPRSVICSPNHMSRTVPVVRMRVVWTRYHQEGCMVTR